LELEEAGSLQPTVDSLQLKRESKEGLTAETLRALRSERREETESDFTTEDAESTEVRRTGTGD
jgi:hypothetical protein